MPMDPLDALLAGSGPAPALDPLDALLAQAPAEPKRPNTLFDPLHGNLKTFTLGEGENAVETYERALDRAIYVKDHQDGAGWYFPNNRRAPDTLNQGQIGKGVEGGVQNFASPAVFPDGKSYMVRHGDGAVRSNEAGGWFIKEPDGTWSKAKDSLEPGEAISARLSKEQEERRLDDARYQRDLTDPYSTVATRGVDKVTGSTLNLLGGVAGLVSDDAGDALRGVGKSLSMAYDRDVEAASEAYKAEGRPAMAVVNRLGSELGPGLASNAVLMGLSGGVGSGATIGVRSLGAAPGIAKTIGAIAAALPEASGEGADAKEAAKKEFLAQGWSDAKAEEKADSVYRKTVAANMLLLSAGNVAGFGIEGKAIKDQIRAAAREASEQTTKLGLKGFAKEIGKSALQESVIEEGLQYGIQEAAKKEASWAGMVPQTLKETYGTKEGWKAIGESLPQTLIMGAVQGGGQGRYLSEKTRASELARAQGLQAKADALEPAPAPVPNAQGGSYQYDPATRTVSRVEADGTTRPFDPNRDSADELDKLLAQTAPVAPQHQEGQPALGWRGQPTLSGPTALPGPAPIQGESAEVAALQGQLAEARRDAAMFPHVPQKQDFVARLEAQLQGLGVARVLPGDATPKPMGLAPKVETEAQAAEANLGMLPWDPARQAAAKHLQGLVQRLQPKTHGLPDRFGVDREDTNAPWLQGAGLVPSEHLANLANGQTPLIQDQQTWKRPAPASEAKQGEPLIHGITQNENTGPVVKESLTPDATVKESLTVQGEQGVAGPRFGLDDHEITERIISRRDELLRDNPGLSIQEAASMAIHEDLDVGAEIIRGLQKGDILENDQGVRFVLEVNRRGKKTLSLIREDGTPGEHAVDASSREANAIAASSRVNRQPPPAQSDGLTRADYGLAPKGSRNTGPAAPKAEGAPVDTTPPNRTVKDHEWENQTLAVNTLRTHSESDPVLGPKFAVKQAADIERAIDEAIARGGNPEEAAAEVYNGILRGKTGLAFIAQPAVEAIFAYARQRNAGLAKSGELAGVIKRRLAPVAPPKAFQRPTELNRREGENTFQWIRREAEFYAAHPEQADEAYRANSQTKGGRILGGDQAGEIFGGIQDSPVEGWAVQPDEDASRIISRLEDAAIKAPVPAGTPNLIVITGGPQASGKSTLAENLIDQNKAAYVLDGLNLDPSQVSKTIDKILASGKKAAYSVTVAPIVDMVQRNAHRFRKTGRPVNAAHQAMNLVKAREAIRAIHEKYGNSIDVAVDVAVNGSGVGIQHMSPTEGIAWIDREINGRSESDLAGQAVQTHLETIGKLHDEQPFTEDELDALRNAAAGDDEHSPRLYGEYNRRLSELVEQPRGSRGVPKTGGTGQQAPEGSDGRDSEEGRQPGLKPDFTLDGEPVFIPENRPDLKARLEKAKATAEEGQARITAQVNISDKLKNLQHQKVGATLAAEKRSIAEALRPEDGPSMPMSPEEKLAFLNTQLGNLQRMKTNGKPKVQARVSQQMDEIRRQIAELRPLIEKSAEVAEKPEPTTRKKPTREELLAKMKEMGNLEVIPVGDKDKGITAGKTLYGVSGQSGKRELVRINVTKVDGDNITYTVTHPTLGTATPATSTLAQLLGWASPDKAKAEAALATPTPRESAKAEALHANAQVNDALAKFIKAVGKSGNGGVALMGPPITQEILEAGADLVMALVDAGYANFKAMALGVKDALNTPQLRRSFELAYDAYRTFDETLPARADGETLAKYAENDTITEDGATDGRQPDRKPDLLHDEERPGDGAGAAGDGRPAGGGGLGGKKGGSGHAGGGKKRARQPRSGTGDVQQPDADGGGTESGSGGSGAQGLEEDSSLETGSGPNGPVSPERNSLGTVRGTDGALNYDVRSGGLSTENLSTEGGKKRAGANNVKAIRIAKGLKASNRIATPEEQAALSKFVGWGAIDKAVDSWRARQAELLAEDKKDEAQKKWEKDWLPIYKELSGILTPAELRRARSSIRNAHYTSQDVISGAWECVRRLGLDGGSALEPSAGIGNFIGLAPNSFNWGAVELDSMTADILKGLYPAAAVANIGFQDVVPKANHDLVISNFPFDGNFKLNYKGEKFALHDFFFLQGLEHLKPGGFLVGITSHYTMDKLTPRVRAILAQEAEFRGAIRLPNDAFSKNAGTQVVTDLIFLQKKGPGVEPSTLSWGKTKPVTVLNRKGEESEQEVNEYFHNHPDMVLGTWGAGGMENIDQLTVNPFHDRGTLQAQIQKAAKLLPANMLPNDYAPESEPVELEVRPGLSEGGFAGQRGEKVGSIVLKDGKVGILDHTGGLSPLPSGETKGGKPVYLETLSKEQAQDLRDFQTLRDAFADLVTLEKSDATDEDIEAAREALNQAYDRMVRPRQWKKSGATEPSQLTRKVKSTSHPLKWLQSDLDFYALASLEMEKGGKIVKAPILEKRMLRPREEPADESLEGVAAGYAASLAWRGHVDLGWIANKTGMSISDIEESLPKERLAFQNPANGEWEPGHVYLSGNVRKKMAEAAAAGLDENEMALRSIQPEFKSMPEISMSPISSWVPDSTIEKFLADRLGINGFRVSLDSFGKRNFFPEDNTKKLTKYQRRWSAAPSIDSDEFGAAGVRFRTMLEKTFNGQKVVVKIYDENGSIIGTDQETTAIAQERQKALANAYEEWAQAHPDDFEQAYNEKVNHSVAAQWPVPAVERYPGASLSIMLEDFQKRVVERALTVNTLFAHVVGSGKTFSMVTTAMEAKRRGLCSKPVLTTLNEAVGTVTAQAKALYPGANVMCLPENPTMEQRRAFAHQVRTQDVDLVVMPMSAFNMIGDAREDIEPLIQQMEDELEDTLRGISDKRERQRTQKRAQAQIDKLRKGLQDQAKRSTDSGMPTWNDFGFDWLMVDEAHAYKKLGFTTTKNGIKGIDTTRSQRAFSLYVKAQKVMAMQGAQRGVIFATGTPVSNTMAELWTIGRFLDPAGLEDFGIKTFDDFVGTFGSIEQRDELTATQEYKSYDVLGKFKNGHEFMTWFGRYADRVGSDQIKRSSLPVPIGGRRKIIDLDPSPTTERIIKGLAERLKAWYKMTPKERKELHLEAEAIVVEGLALGASIDPRLVDPRLPFDPGSKLSIAIQDAYEIWSDKALTKEKATTVIFLDRYQSPDPDKSIEGAPYKGLPRFNAHHEIRDRLIKMGVPASEIHVMTDGTKKTNREAMVKANDGEIRVVIATTEKGGTGLNFQEHLYGLLAIDTPARPSDTIQREGRQLRSGNRFMTVLQNVYGTKKTLDAKRAQTNFRKVQFFDQFMFSKDGMVSSEFDDISTDDAMTYNDMIGAFSGDARILRKTELERELRDMDRQRRGYYLNRGKARGQVASLEATLSADGGRLDRLTAAAELAKPVADVLFKRREAKAQAEAEWKLANDRHDGNVIAGVESTAPAKPKADPIDKWTARPKEALEFEKKAADALDAPWTWNEVWGRGDDYQAKDSREFDSEPIDIGGGYTVKGIWSVRRYGATKFNALTIKTGFEWEVRDASGSLALSGESSWINANPVLMDIEKEANTTAIAPTRLQKQMEEDKRTYANLKKVADQGEWSKESEHKAKVDELAEIMTGLLSDGVLDDKGDEEIHSDVVDDEAPAPKPEEDDDRAGEAGFINIGDMADAARELLAKLKGKDKASLEADQAERAEMDAVLQEIQDAVGSVPIGENLSKTAKTMDLPSRLAQRLPQTFGYVFEQIKRWHLETNRHEASHAEARKVWYGVSREERAKMFAFMADARFEDPQDDGSRGRRYTAAELKEKGFSDAAIQAYTTTLNDYREQLQQLANAARSKALLASLAKITEKDELDSMLDELDGEDREKAEARIQALEEQIEAAQFLANRYEGLLLMETAYVPLVRHGKLAVRYTDADGNVVGLILGDTAREVKAKMLEWEKLEPGLREHQRSPILKWNREGRSEKNPSLDAMRKAAAIVGLDPAIAENLTDAYEVMNLQGAYAGSFKKHLRHATGTPGFDLDPVMAHASYTMAAGRYKAHLMHTGEIAKRLSGLEEDRSHGVSRHRDVIDYLKRLQQDVVTNPVSPFVVQAQQVVAGMTLGLNPAFSVQQVLQKLTHELPTMAGIYGFRDASRYITTAAKVATKMAFSRGKAWDAISASDFQGIASDPEAMARELKVALQEAEEEGIFMDAVHQETRSAASGKDTAFLRGRQKIENVVFIIVQATETHNRRQTFIAQYLLAREVGYPAEAGFDPNKQPDKLGKPTGSKMVKLNPHAAIVLCGKQIDWIHNRRGVTNRSQFQRGANGLGMIPTQFRYFVAEFIQQMFQVSKNDYQRRINQGSSKQAAFMGATAPMAASMAALFAGAGMAGLPFLTALLDLWEILWNDLLGQTAPMKWWRSKINSQFLKHGLPGYLGLAMERSLGMGDPFQATRGAGLRQNSLELIVGALGALPKALDSSLRKLGRRDVAGAVGEVLPKGVKNVIRGASEKDARLGDGVVLPMTPTERLQRSVGLNPLRLSEARDVIEEGKRDKANAKSAADALVSPLARAIHAKDEAGRVKALKAIADYNRKMTQAGRQSETISLGTIRSRIRGEMGDVKKARKLGLVER